MLATIYFAASAQATHPRPKGATPMRLSLVPAYTACASPNRTHGPPLAFPSCAPPAQTSAQATVGTPDAFGGAANSTSSILFVNAPSVPGPPNEADMWIEIRLNDVRCVPSGANCGSANASGPADYSGEIRFKLTMRVTDHWSASVPGGGPDAATVQGDVVIEWPDGHSCSETASTSIGSTCNVGTTVNALIPGALQEKRMILEIDNVAVYDGGADGLAETDDNTVFARSGIFVP